jgi:hypothetical protein
VSNSNQNKNSVPQSFFVGAGLKCKSGVACPKMNITSWKNIQKTKQNGDSPDCVSGYKARKNLKI